MSPVTNITLCWTLPAVLGSISLLHSLYRSPCNSLVIFVSFYELLMASAGLGQSLLFCTTLDRSLMLSADRHELQYVPMVSNDSHWFLGF